LIEDKATLDIAPGYPLAVHCFQGFGCLLCSQHILGKRCPVVSILRIALSEIEPGVGMRSHVQVIIGLSETKVRLEAAGQLWIPALGTLIASAGFRIATKGQAAVAQCLEVLGSEAVTYHHGLTAEHEHCREAHPFDELPSVRVQGPGQQ
jgi:hypothetical protein